MKAAPVFSILLDGTVLPRAKFFSSLEGEIKGAFYQKGISIEPSSPIFRSHGKNVWRVVSESSTSITAYRLKLSYDQETKKERIDVYKDSISGLPLSVWDFKAFTSSIRSSESNRRLYYRGTVRNKLTKKQKQKWDYFFRPDRSKISGAYDSIILECEKDLEEAKGNLSKSKIWIGIFLFQLFALVLGAYFMIDGLGDILLPIFGVYCLAFLISLFRNTVSLNISKLGNEVDKLENYLYDIKTERANTMAQLGKIVLPNDKVVEDWLEEEVGYMETESRAKYIFSDDTKPPKIFKSLGVFQPDFKDVAKEFPKKVSTMFGFKKTKQDLMYSGLYMVLIFMTNEKICITKFFYDFILAKKYGENNREYHYSDLVGIAINSKLIENPFEDDDVEKQEINTIWMSFTDSNDIEIAIIDRDTSESINQLMRNNQEAAQEENDDWLDLVNLPEDEEELRLKRAANLRMPDALEIIRKVKDQKLKLSKWNSTKTEAQQKERASENLKGR